jgi:hypothetical protein
LELAVEYGLGDKGLTIRLAYNLKSVMQVLVGK